MKAKPLLLQQPVTQKGDMPSQDLVQVIQQLCRILDGQTAQIADLTARVEALEP